MRRPLVRVPKKRMKQIIRNRLSAFQSYIRKKATKKGLSLSHEIKTISNSVLENNYIAKIDEDIDGKTESCGGFPLVDSKIIDNNYLYRSISSIEKCFRKTPLKRPNTKIGFVSQSRKETTKDVHIKNLKRIDSSSIKDLQEDGCSLFKGNNSIFLDGKHMGRRYIKENCLGHSDLWNTVGQNVLDFAFSGECDKIINLPTLDKEKNSSLDAETTPMYPEALFDIDD